VSRKRNTYMLPNGVQVSYKTMTRLIKLNIYSVFDFTLLRRRSKYDMGMV